MSKKRNVIKISEHALLRLLIRRYGQQDLVDQALKEITEELGNKFYRMSGELKVLLKDGLEARIINNQLITVIKNNYFAEKNLEAPNEK